MAKAKLGTLTEKWITGKTEKQLTVKTERHKTVDDKKIMQTLYMSTTVLCLSVMTKG